MVITVMAVILFVLSKESSVSRRSDIVRPPLYDTPSYEEVNDGEAITVTLKAKEDCDLGSLSVVLVNTDSSGQGLITFDMRDETGAEIFSVTIGEQSVPVGDWYEIGSPAFHMTAGQAYKLTVSAKDCEPYFIRTQSQATDRVMPFCEVVKNTDGVELSYGISIGTSFASGERLRYGEIFYGSYVLVILAAVFALALIIFGADRCKEVLSATRIPDVWNRFGSDIFLAVLFVTICLSIYINGYLERIFISADSAGYLREAVNLASGYGFHYDGLAGYRDSWFANWPIIYPAMIALVMKLTGMEVYAASKLLSMLLVGVIILILRLTYKREAWFYALFMTDLGLMYLYWYSWSELPFIMFMILFVLSLARVLGDEQDRIPGYVCLGLSMVMCFLTRYFGMFTFGVTGFYILILFIDRFRQSRDAGRIHIRTLVDKKVISLVITSVASGIICLAYLINNKIQNGMPSGVSRSMWWDDYQSLTNDLIKALLAEIFNVFHMDTPEYISSMDYSRSVWIVVLVLVVMGICVFRNCRRYSRESVFITTGVIYYVMFIVIRYFSSMDTFYYRFFAPATFLLLLGIAGILSEHLRGGKLYPCLLGGFTALLLICAWGDVADHIAGHEMPYYDIMRMSWDEDYAEIPERSVVIFSPLDYRSQFYRADVVEGTIEPADTMDSIRDRYHGSDYMCILTGDAEAMLESGIYYAGIEAAITQSIKPDGKYCVIPLERQP